MAIATAVASQAAQSRTSQAGHAIVEIAQRIRHKFRDQPADLEILSAAQGEPASQDRTAELARALERATAEDLAFRRDIYALWDQSGNMPMTATGDAVVNVTRGRADKVIQLRDVHGDLTINLPLDSFTEIAQGKTRIRSQFRRAKVTLDFGEWSIGIVENMHENATAAAKTVHTARSGLVLPQSGVDMAQRLSTAHHEAQQLTQRGLVTICPTDPLHTHAPRDTDVYTGNTHLCRRLSTADRRQCVQCICD
jgi:hypothetical protein